MRQITSLAIAVVASFALLVAASAVVTKRPTLLLVGLIVATCAIYRAWRTHLNLADVPEPAVPWFHSRELGWLTPCVITLLVLAFVKLDSYPGFRADETLILQFPANYARHGIWGMRTGEQLEPWLWMTSTGPPVIFPAAALMAKLRLSVGLARLISGFYLVLCVGSVYLFCRRSHGAMAALVAVVSVLGFAETTNTGRMFLGDFAACAFLWLGASGWLVAIEQDGRRSTVGLVVAGILLGLMVLAKLAYSVSGLGFFAYALYDRTTDRRVGIRHLLGPIVLVLFVNLPWELYKSQSDGLLVNRVATTGWGAAYANLHIAGLPDKAKEVLARPELVLAVAGFVFGIGAGTRRRRATVLATCIGFVPLLWWLTFELVLTRYLILPTLAAMVIAAPLVAAAVNHVRRNGVRDVASACALAVVIGGLLLPSVRVAANLGRVLSAPTAQWAELAIVRELERRTTPSTLVYSNDVPLSLLFFVDRPIRRTPTTQAGEIPTGAVYLEVDEVTVADDALEVVAQAGRFRLWQRR